ncbi:hypothetical protein [Kribbella solani]|uniref:hypothetical protein n=1 Tax=Kribbella solani TaxID=236067 RepID=UPI0029BB9E41|nr:hypothetical protein [Kribbella solani]MDX2973398.1 hypothetical protein [Kribbella solani]
MVELAADNVVGCPVVAVGMGDERRPVTELSLHELGTQGVKVKCLLGSGAFDGDASLLLAEHVEGDGVAVVRLQELLALVVETIHLSLGGGDFVGAEW